MDAEEAFFGAGGGSVGVVVGEADDALDGAAMGGELEADAAAEGDAPLFFEGFFLFLLLALPAFVAAGAICADGKEVQFCGRVRAAGAGRFDRKKSGLRWRG